MPKRPLTAHGSNGLFHPTKPRANGVKAVHSLLELVRKVLERQKRT